MKATCRIPVTVNSTYDQLKQLIPTNYLKVEVRREPKTEVMQTKSKGSEIATVPFSILEEQLYDF